MPASDGVPSDFLTFIAEKREFPPLSNQHQIAFTLGRDLLGFKCSLSASLPLGRDAPERAGSDRDREAGRDGSAGSAQAIKAGVGQGRPSIWELSRASREEIKSQDLYYAQQSISELNAYIKYIILNIYSGRQD